LISGDNRLSAIGTLVERQTRMVRLVRAAPVAFWALASLLADGMNTSDAAGCPRRAYLVDSWSAIAARALGSIDTAAGTPA
jgi:hypothetical protein